MKALFFFCVLGCLGLWGWALYWPKPVEPLPERYVGAWIWEGFEPPIGKDGKRLPMSNPFPPGQHRRFTFRADGTYTLQVFAAGEHEMLRFDGLVRLAADNVLEMTAISENRVKTETPETMRYQASWGRDGKGEFMKLIQELQTAEEKAKLKQGHERYLRAIRASDDS